MPLRNCPQSKSWCPHYHPDMCADVEPGKHDPCIHVRAVLASRAATSLAAVTALLLSREWRISPKVGDEQMSMANEVIGLMQRKEIATESQ